MQKLLVLVESLLNLAVKLVLFVLVFLTAALPGNPLEPIVKNENADNPYIQQYKGTQISAHRSGAGAAPENTLMAFQEMSNKKDYYGVDTFEFDVQITADGELILLHNLTYDDTSNAVEEFGHKNVYASSLTYEEARRLNLGENFCLNGEYPYRGLRGNDIPQNLRVVKCEDVIDYIESHSNGKKYNYIIEIKSHSFSGMRAADKLYNIVNSRDMKDRVIWATFQPDVSLYMEHKYPDMPRSAGVAEVIEFYQYARMGWDLNELDVSYVALQIPYGESAFNLINTGTRELVNYAHKYNIAVQYWTINSEDEAAVLLDSGADCIMSDYPQMVNKVKKSHKYKAEKPSIFEVKGVRPVIAS